MPGGVARVVARKEKRIEEDGEPRVQVAHAGVEIQHVRRADDRDATRLENAMQLAGKRELILDMLDDLEAAGDVE